MGKQRTPTMQAAFIAAIVLASCAVFALPLDSSFTADARASLSILTAAALLWATEAIPAYATALLVIALQIVLLGDVTNSDGASWERFVNVWGSPLIWLFFGGFVLSAGACKTGLDRWFVRNVLAWFQGSRPLFLAACMLQTFIWSMFMSNTATATMMVAVASPIIATPATDKDFKIALLLGVAVAANLGGMGTIVGSPPNAVAAGALRGVAPVDFLGWMQLGLPPAIVLVAAAWGLLCLRYIRFTRPGERPPPPISLGDAEASAAPEAPTWAKLVVMASFTATVGLWLTTSLHGIPSTAVAFVPICSLTAAQVLDDQDLRRLPWDVLLLIAGGLSLGVGVAESGLAEWFADRAVPPGVGAATTAAVFCYVTIIASNVMSNTAAANIMIPLALASAVGDPKLAAAGPALCASTAMCLPVSTPPNAIVYGTGKIGSKELLVIGAGMAIVAPIVVLAWLNFIGR